MTRRSKIFAVVTLFLTICLGVAVIGQVFSQPTANAASILVYKGVNLSAAEFSGDILPGVYDDTYTYPTPSEVDYFASKGMNTIRFPFAWERLQPTANGDFNPTELGRLTSLANYIVSKNMTVILDPHNYARYYGVVVGSGVPSGLLANFWQRLAALYKNNSHVIFSLMNEPHDMATELWLSDANAAIAAIRGTGANNLILVPGNGYTGADGWSDTYYGTPNATVMLGVQDPTNNYAYDAHQYMDSDSSGNSAVCVSATIGSQRLQNFTTWLRQHGKRAMLGEFAGGRNQTCYTALEDMLTYVDNNADVWLGWTYWAAGPWWDNYIFTIEPANGVERPQMAILSRHLGGTPNPTPTATATATVKPTTAPATATPKPTTVPPTTTPTTAPATPTPRPTLTPTPVTGGQYAIRYRVDASWNTGYNVAVRVSNNGSSTVNSWRVSWQLDHGETLANYWNAKCSLSGSTVTCTNLDYNSNLHANGGSTGFGIQFNTRNGRITHPSKFIVNGQSVQIS